MLLFLFSNMCGHCRRVRPVWDQFQSLFENNDKFCTSEIDCWTNWEDCKGYKRNGFPTFYIVSGEYKRMVNVNRTLEGFIELGREMERADYSSLPRLLPSSLKRYPAFVFTCNSSSYWLFKEINASQDLYMSENEEGFKLVVKMSRDTTIEYKGEETPEGITAFIMDYSLFPFGNWTESDAKNRTSRKPIYLVYEDIEHISFFRKILVKYSEDFVFLNVSYQESKSEFKGIVNETTHPPFLLIVSENRFRIISPDEIHQKLPGILKEYKDGELAMEQIRESRIAWAPLSAASFCILFFLFKMFEKELQKVE